MEWAARAIGTFYIIAGLVVIRGARQEMLLDRMIEAIELGAGKAANPAERHATFGGLLIALLTLCSGVALILLSAWALPLFALCGLTQAAFLLYVGRHLPPTTPLEALGRRRTTNAFIVYLVATAFVGWLYRDHVLRDWPPAEPAWMGGAATALVAAFAVLIWHARRLDGDSRPGNQPASVDNDEPGLYRDEPLHEIVPGRDVLRFAPEFGCYPLWLEETGDNIDPGRLPIDKGLKQRIEAWDARFQARDPQEAPVATEEQPWIAEGREILSALEATFGPIVSEERFR